MSHQRCRFYSVGECRSGSRCRFLHTDATPRHPSPALIPERPERETSTSQPPVTASATPRAIPGYLYDPVTNRYYRAPPSSSSPASSTCTFPSSPSTSSTPTFSEQTSTAPLSRRLVVPSPCGRPFPFHCPLSRALMCREQRPRQFLPLPLSPTAVARPAEPHQGRPDACTGLAVRAIPHRRGWRAFRWLGSFGSGLVAHGVVEAATRERVCREVGRRAEARGTDQVSALRWAPIVHDTCSISELGSGGRSGTVRVCRLLPGGESIPLCSLSPRRTSVFETQWSPDARLLSLGVCQRGMVYDVATTALVSAVYTGKSDVLSQCWTADASVLCNGTRGGRCRFVDLRAPAQLRESLVHKSSVVAIHLLRDDAIVLTCSLDGIIKLSDRRNLATPLVKLQDPTRNRDMISVPFRPITDEMAELICCVGLDNKIRAWSLWTGLPVPKVRAVSLSLDELVEPVSSCLAFVPNGLLHVKSTSSMILYS